MAPVLVLGTAQLTTSYGLGNRGRSNDDASAIAMLRAANAAGVGVLDTAPSYGRAEEVIGEANVDASVVTKLDPSLAPRASLDRSLVRLRRSTVAAVLIHDPGLVLDDPSGEVDRAAELLGAGADAVGASVYDVAQATAVLEDRRLGMVQLPLNVADRRAIDVLDTASAWGTVVHARSVFLQGALLLAVSELPPHLRPLAPVIGLVDRCAADLGCSRASVLLRWVRDVSGLHGVVVGAERWSQAAHLIEAFTTHPPLPATWTKAFHDLPDLPNEVVDPRRWPSL